MEYGWKPGHSRSKKNGVGVGVRELVGLAVIVLFVVNFAVMFNLQKGMGSLEHKKEELKNKEKQLEFRAQMARRAEVISSFWW